MNILLLGASPSRTSSSRALLADVGERLAGLGHHLSWLEVCDLPSQALLHADFHNADILAALAQVEEAEAVVIATPVYQASYTGILKVFLDILPQDGLKNKLVLPLAVGGSQSHMLAIDYALRPVLQALSAELVLPGIYATSAQLKGAGGQAYAVEAALATRLERGIARLHSESRRYYVDNKEFLHRTPSATAELALR
ncbi:NADPH-dependent FMN reductase [Undibacterium sp. CY18W]|uniref:NADPH-dependent FMN reductase n=1 Tax=Undibacterium hunanense TaxID=2762292 RepID=A0ABR6ZQ36_9BURK|nr:NADPH-dependent FMN reductase [Undibacterium hunanense]